MMNYIDQVKYSINPMEFTDFDDDFLDEMGYQDYDYDIPEEIQEELYGNEKG